MTQSVFAELMARMDAEAARPLLRIDGSLSIEERWYRLRLNYATFQALVDAGLDDWMNSDPYQIADWVALFTPIEQSAWHDVRESGLPLWPQLPVGRYFLDFGNPITKVALECDGRRWHPPGKDAARDAWLTARGWRIYRVPGWRCHATMERPEDWPLMSKDERAAWQRHRDQNTMAGVMKSLAAHFPGA